MRKSILSLVLVFAFLAGKAQTPVIDTAAHNITCAKIVPVKGQFSDSTLSYYLGAYAINDNLKNSATFYWCLMYGVTDSTGTVVKPGGVSAQGNYVLTGENYQKWCNSEPCDSWPLQVIGQAYGLVFPPVTGKPNKN
jgi:hypothetical protein